MKEIKLTTGQVTIVDDDDYSILSKRSWRIDKDGYVISGSSKNNKKYNIRMHRFILELTDPSILSDHKDRNKLNNQRSNLRTCNRSENQKNKTPRGRSKYLGVMYQKYQVPTKHGLIEHEYIIARIRVNSKYIKLGTFRTEEEAAFSYDQAARKYHGEFANLNFK
mgnify:CR=1 FL=1